MSRSLFQEVPDPGKTINQESISKWNLNQFHKELDQKLLKKQYTTPSHSRALATHLLTHMANSVLEHEEP